MSSLTRKQKEIGLIVLSSLFCIAIIAYSYFTFFSPNKESLAVAETTLTTDRQVLFALEQQLADQPEIPVASSLELQKKVPVDSLTELVLLQIEKAEVVSQSLVQSVGFTEGPFVIEAPPEGVETLQELLVSLSIETPTYTTLESFIAELERLDRILIIDSIQFSSLGEVTTADQEDEKLQLNLTFSAFYRPDLTELLEESPKVDTPAPADKVNPLPANNGIDTGEVVVTSETETTSIEGQTTENDAEEETTTESNSVTSNFETQTYTVQPGDTLYSISIKYYGDRFGEELIKQANGLKTDKVLANSTLIIPK
ncbi:LysM peptidoglycan-binding domain-containing protein [Paenisporosarcina sp. NPDC076898]|uniref:LysM peptidoglycan-binding domain-containing protein n=1 Tax=unclassified Paenisporosarcina TaxID=2642018 RepID=UPI003CFDDA90